MIFLAISIIVLFVLFLNDGHYYGGLVWIDTPLWKKIFFSIVVGFVLNVIFYAISMWVLGGGMPIVFYEPKVEHILEEIKSRDNDEKDNIFLVQSGTTYFYVSNGSFTEISLDAVDSINIDRNNIRRIKILSPKFKKNWYQIVLFAFGPILLDEKYIIFIQNDREIKKGGWREAWLFSY